jgi:hypothetical protein
VQPPPDPIGPGAQERPRLPDVVGDEDVPDGTAAAQGRPEPRVRPDEDEPGRRPSAGRQERGRQDGQYGRVGDRQPRDVEQHRVVRFEQGVEDLAQPRSIRSAQHADEGRTADVARQVVAVDPGGGSHSGHQPVRSPQLR